MGSFPIFGFSFMVVTFAIVDKHFNKNIYKYIIDVKIVPVLTFLFKKNGLLIIRRAIFVLKKYLRNRIE